MAGLRQDYFWHFLVFVAANIGVQMVSTSLAFFCTSVHRAFAHASMIANTLFSFYALSCGFFVQVYIISIFIIS